MRDDGTFGGNLELVACSKLLNISISIHQLGQKVWKINNDGATELQIVYHEHEHYSSTIKLNFQHDAEHSEKQSKHKVKQAKKKGKKPKPDEIQELEKTIEHLSI